MLMDLLLTSTDNLFYDSNSDTGSNYSANFLYGDGTSAVQVVPQDRTSTLYFMGKSTTSHLSLV
jgi:hypothetical protein